MKTIYLLVFSLLISMSTLYAKGDSLVQMIGFNYTMKMSYRNIATSDAALKSQINSASGYKFADDIGLFYQLILPSRIGLRMGIKYTNKGFIINDYSDFGYAHLAGEKYKVGFHYISIPIQISYHRVSKKVKKYHFYPFLELSYDALLYTSKKSVNTSLPTEKIKPSNPEFQNYRNHSLSTAFGMGWMYTISPQWLIGFRAYFTTDILTIYKTGLWDTRLDASAIGIEVKYNLLKKRN